MSISQMIQAYHGDLANDEHHRYRSWEHCFGFFRRHTPTEITGQRDSAALQLGFYLASWGMYRGASFLLQHAYTIHLGVIDALTSPEFAPLWAREYGINDDDLTNVPVVLSAIQAVRDAYAPFRQPTDTLVTKVLLGVFGCLPACDRYFIAGFKRYGLSYSYLNERFIRRLLKFCGDNLSALRREQDRIKKIGGIHYPVMKLVDMYFWQTGYEGC